MVAQPPCMTDTRRSSLSASEHEVSAVGRPGQVDRRRPNSSRRSVLPARNLARRFAVDVADPQAPVGPVGDVSAVGRYDGADVAKLHRKPAHWFRDPDGVFVSAAACVSRPARRHCQRDPDQSRPRCGAAVSAASNADSNRVRRRRRFASAPRRSPRRASAMSRSRTLSFLLQGAARQNAESASGVAAGRACQSGSRPRIAATVSEIVSPRERDRGGQPASRTAHTRKPRYRYACRLACRAPGPGSCTRGSRG